MTKKADDTLTSMFKEQEAAQDNRCAPDKADTYKDNHVSEEDRIRILYLEKALRSACTAVCYLRQSMLELDLKSFYESDEIKESVYSYEKKMFCIDIKFHDAKKMLEIHIPDILPHRNSSGNVEYMDTLAYFLDEFRKNQPEAYASVQEYTSSGAMLTVIHSYPAAYMVRDHDNVELKQVIDLLHIYGFMRSDRGDYLDLFLTARTKADCRRGVILLLTSKAGTLPDISDFCG